MWRRRASVPHWDRLFETAAAQEGYFTTRQAAEAGLAFAGIAPPTLRIYPLETHVAEKLHAYTMPRPRPNSRVKDLPDIAPLATAGAIDAKRLRQALEQTFAFRGTHPLPAALPEPPPAWEAPYAAMAREGTN